LPFVLTIRVLKQTELEGVSYINLSTTAPDTVVSFGLKSTNGTIIHWAKKAVVV